MALTNKTFSDLITFTRSGTATRVNSAGLIEDVAANTPRFDHDPVTGAAKGLLIEESRTNSVSSTDLKNSTTFPKIRSLMIPTARTTSPTGEANAFFLMKNADASNTHYFTYDVASFDDVDFTFSIFLKADSRSQFYVRALDADSTGERSSCRFDLAALTATTDTIGGVATVSGGAVEDYGNGWYRCSYSGNTNGAGGTLSFWMMLSVAGSEIYSGDGESGLFVYAPQVEAGTFPTSYIDTTPTFTSRASTATYTDSAGVIQEAAVDEARTTYKRIGGAWVSAGTLHEAAETNELTNSQDFGDAAWTKTRAVVQRNAALAPDGTASADKLVEDTTATNSSFVGQSVTLGASSDYVFSIYAKAAERSRVLIRENTASGFFASFDLSSGAKLSKTASTLVTSEIQDAGNGWYRCSMIWQNVTGAAREMSIYILDDSGVDHGDASYTGDGTSGVYIWGAQLEQSSLGYPTSYIPTPDSFTSRTGDARYTDSAGVIQTSSGTERNANYAYVGGAWTITKPLYEAAATNICLQSEDLSTTWTNTGTTETTNAAVAPDGATTADELVEDTSTGSHYMTQNITLSNTNDHTLSCYIKQAAGTRGFWLRTNNEGPNIYVAVDPADGSIIELGSDSQIVAAGVIDVGSGWYRVWLTWSPTDTTAGILLGLQEDNTAQGDLDSYTGDGSSSVYVWGAQCEEGSLSSYIPTTTTSVTRNADVTSSGTVTRSADVVSSSTVTRNADNASITGTAFSDWYNASEGTLYAEVRADDTDNTSGDPFFLIDDTTVNNLIRLDRYSTSFALRITTGGAAQVSANIAGAPEPNTTDYHKMAAAFKVNDVAWSFNGGTVGTDTSATIPTGLSRMVISNGLFNGHIKNIKFYPSRLTDAELQALTT